jgi:hypothetical protein
MTKRRILAALLTLAAVMAFATAVAADPRNFRAHLAGFGISETTLAQGQTVFQLSEDGSELSYKLIVADLDNVFMAHIHQSSDNRIVAWLYPQEPFAFSPTMTTPPASWISGTYNGVLIEGVIRADDLMGPLAGMSMSDLLMLLENDGAYVNVHTSDFVNPPNTGPGDFFPGEIRGHIH